MNRRGRKIRKWVLLGHAAVISVLCMAGGITDCRKIDRDIIPVKVISTAPSTPPSESNKKNNAEPAAPEPNSEKPETTPAEQKPAPKPPEPEPPQKPQPQPEPPKKEPKPKQPEKIKSEPPERAVTTEPVPEKTAEKQPEPEKKKNDWQARSAADIRESARLDPVESTETSRTPRQPLVDASQFARQLESQLNALQQREQATSSSSSQSSRRASENVIRQYVQAVGSLLRRRWQQPSRQSIPKHVPAPVVHLVIRRDGTVQGATLSTESGLAAMDSSIRQLLQRTKKLPAPSRYGIDRHSLNINVRFVLETD